MTDDVGFTLTDSLPDENATVGKEKRPNSVRAAA